MSSNFEEILEWIKLCTWLTWSPEVIDHDYDFTPRHRHDHLTVEWSMVLPKEIDHVAEFEEYIMDQYLEERRKAEEARKAQEAARRAAMQPRVMQEADLYPNIHTFIDPDRGWAYGFPKSMPKTQYDAMSFDELKQWFIDNGYPKSMNSLYFRTWNEVV